MSKITHVLAKLRTTVSDSAVSSCNSWKTPWVTRLLPATDSHCTWAVSGISTQSPHSSKPCKINTKRQNKFTTLRRQTPRRNSRVHVVTLDLLQERLLLLIVLPEATRCLCAPVLLLHMLVRRLGRNRGRIRSRQIIYGRR